MCLHRLIAAAAVAAPLAACQPAAAPEKAAEPPAAETAAVAPPATPTVPNTPITYSCEDGKTVVATYAGETATVVYEGKTYAMTTQLSASGARYQGDGLQWWTKGLTEGMVAPIPAGQTDPADGTDVTCTAPPAPPSPTV